MSTLKIKLLPNNVVKRKLGVNLLPGGKKQKLGSPPEAVEVDDDVALAEEAIADQVAIDEDDAGGDELPCDVEADDDEDDPEMVECAKCGAISHVSAGKCLKEGCDYIFKFTATGHLIDGFVVGEDSVEYVDDEDVEEEEEYEDSDESDESDSIDEDEGCPWVDDESDSSWHP